MQEPGFQVHPDELRQAAGRISDLVGSHEDGPTPGLQADAFGHARLADAADRFRTGLGRHTDWLTRTTHETVTALRASAAEYEARDDAAAAALTRLGLAAGGGNG
jgi:hypothetical protein